MRHLLLVLLAAGALSLTGCNEQQIARAAEISAAADAKLAQADAALALAQQAVDQGKVLAEQVGSVKAQQIIGQAQQALAAAGDAREAAVAAADAGHKAVAAAKAAQDAGGSTVDVILAVIGTLIPAVAAFIPVLRKAIADGTALVQTVQGVEAAKEKMAPEQVAILHGELAKAQDQAAKDRVALVKAAA